LALNNLYFYLIVASTCLMAAGAYVINDYFDIRGDFFNNRNNQVGAGISRRQSLFLHQILSFLSVFFGAYVSYKIGRTQFSLIFILVSGLFWFYSTSYKYRLLLGNILVSALAASVPLIVLLFEVSVLNNVYKELIIGTICLKIITVWTLSFSVFIFAGILIYSLVRDMLSVRGDKAIGRKTLSVVFGDKVNQIIIACLSGLSIIGVIVVWRVYLIKFDSLFSELHLLFLIIIPLIVFIYKILKYKVDSEFKQGKMILKFAIIAGISYCLWANYFLTS
jgi:4-hydroxybenzoate polyprenyltransferase